jgi:tRNA G10  N-methylase Trm11
MNGTAFIFGRTPILAYSELQSFFPTASIIVPGVAHIDTSISDPEIYINRLGGTVKIVSIAGSLSYKDGFDTDKVCSAIFSLLSDKVSNRSIVYGISLYGHHTLPVKKILFSLKTQFLTTGIASRYVEASRDQSLSSVVIKKQHVADVCLFCTSDSIIYGITDVVQNFQMWSDRDYNRPAPDPHKGMLPPKVARMVVNIALIKFYENIFQGKLVEKPPTVLDPFCGVGTIVSEALLSGCNVVSGDNDKYAIEHTATNLSWIRTANTVPETLFSKEFLTDATHISTVVAPDSIDAIVTEPFMGDLRITEYTKKPTIPEVKNILKGLEKLYIGCLRDWVRVLKNDALVVMAFPAYGVGNRVVTVKKVIDRCESLGYTLVDGPLEYSRPQAIVRRQFYILRKN